MSPHRLPALATTLGLAFLALSPGSARADTTTCTAITSLPTVITTQGVYCLKKSFTFAAPGNAIDIQANSVTLDCNGYGLLATAGGDRGVRAINHQNATIRNCVLRDFVVGIQASGSGHLVEDNTVFAARDVGIQSFTGPNTIRRNLVVGTGGRTGSTYPAGITTSGPADVLDNTISSVAPMAGSGQATSGIRVTSNTDGEVAHNTLYGIVGDGAALPMAIAVSNSARVSVRDNMLAGDGPGTGIYCTSSNMGAVTGNQVLGFELRVYNCRATWNSGED